MTAATAGRCGTVRVLDLDPELAEALPERERHEAARALLAPTVTIERGDWPARRSDGSEGRIGILILSGLMCREVSIGGTASAELLGLGDLIRPWDGATDDALVPYEVSWQVLEESRVALLGPRFAQAATRWPMLMSALVARTVRRSHTLAVMAAITCTTGLETRLLMLFWHLAERWGKVTSDGVIVPVKLTHETVACVVGARRPSISTALKQLERDGRLMRIHQGGWLLTGEPLRESAPAVSRAA